MAGCAPKSLSSASSVDIGSALPRCLLLVCFSNRPSGSSTFRLSTSVDVAHGLTLLFGIGTKALVPRSASRAEKKAHRRPDEKVQSSQANSGCMLSRARRVHPVIVDWSTALPLPHGLGQLPGETGSYWT